jgi:anti-anti-sigma factor
VRLTVTANFDLACAPDTAAVLDAVRPSRPRHVLIDLSQCDLVDGAGIGILLRAHYRLRRDAGRLTLLNPTPVVRRVLNAGNVDRVLDIRDLRPVLQPARPRLASAPG